MKWKRELVAIPVSDGVQPTQRRDARPLSFVSSSDPDGSKWAVQHRPPRD